MIIKTDKEIETLALEVRPAIEDFIYKMDNDSVMASDYNKIFPSLSALLSGVLIGTRFFLKLLEISDILLSDKELLIQLSKETTKDGVLGLIKTIPLGDTK